jgi:cell division protein FtsQ
MAKRMAVKKPQKQDRSLPRFNMALPKNTARVTAFAGLFVLVIAIFYGVSQLPSLSSGIWPVEKVSFAGSTQRINKEDLIESLDLTDSTGMLSIDLQIVRDKVLENPWVESVDVRKSWPDTLIFSLTEKQPLAILNDGYIFADGTVISTPIMQQDKDSLLVINIAQLDRMEKPKLVMVTELLHSVEQKLAANSFSVREIEIDKTNSWNIKTSTGITIKTGRKNQLQRLDRFLQVYVAIENKSRLSNVDLRYRNGLAVELKVNATSEES